MSNVMLVNLDGFSWVYVLMHRYSKSAFLQVTLNFELEKMILVVDILTQSLLTLLTFISLLSLRKLSIWRGWFLFGVIYYVNVQFTPWKVIDMDNNMVSKIWVGMSATNIHLLQFKIQSHLQKRGLWMMVHQNSLRKGKKTSKISNIKFAILPFSPQNNLTKLSSWVL